MQRQPARPTAARLKPRTEVGTLPLPDLLLDAKENPRAHDPAPPPPLRRLSDIRVLRSSGGVGTSTLLKPPQSRGRRCFAPLAALQRQGALLRTCLGTLMRLGRWSRFLHLLCVRSKPLNAARLLRIRARRAARSKGTLARRSQTSSCPLGRQGARTPLSSRSLCAQRLSFTSPAPSWSSA